MHRDSLYFGRDATLSRCEISLANVERERTAALRKSIQAEMALHESNIEIARLRLLLLGQGQTNLTPSPTIGESIVAESAQHAISDVHDIVAAAEHFLRPRATSSCKKYSFPCNTATHRDDMTAAEVVEDLRAHLVALKRWLVPMLACVRTNSVSSSEAGDGFLMEGGVADRRSSKPHFEAAKPDRQGDFASVRNKKLKKKILGRKKIQAQRYFSFCGNMHDPSGATTMTVSTDLNSNECSKSVSEREKPTFRSNRPQMMHSSSSAAGGSAPPKRSGSAHSRECAIGSSTPQQGKLSLLYS